MSEFDVLEAAYADDMLVHMGEPEGVELATVGTPKKFPAIVGKLRTEAIIIPTGESERTVHRDVCQVMVNCQPGTIGVKTRLFVLKHTSSDASERDRHSFTVQQIDSVTDAWTTVQVWRESLAKVQRRGLEI